MNRNEQQMYSDITSIRKSLEKIANVLEHMNHDSYLAKQEIPKFQDIPGFEGTKDALDNLCNVRKDDDDVHNDYLNDLVQGMNQIEYLNFHNDMSFSFASNDSTAMSDAIYELEYEECLGAIQKALFITGDSDYIAYAGGDKEAGRNFVIETLKNENTTQPTNDPYTYEPNPNRDKGEPALIEYKYVSKVGKIKNDSDFDIRVAAKQYEDEFLANGHTKKECILHYVTEDFGSKGARYTDIIKFAYYLGAHNAYKFNPTDNRGYYACALTHGRWNTGHLVTGGNDQLVKGINEDGKERYFALSFVDNVTDYYKRLDQ